MKRAFTILAVTAVLATPSLQAQQVKESPFEFDSTEFDFGEIEEADGPVSHTFIIYNKSNNPASIETVSTSCGCTTVSYPTEPIIPGKIAELTVTFDPARTQGKVFRDIEVFSQAGRSFDRLVLSATVNPTPLGIEQLYPLLLTEGLELRTALSHVRFGYVGQGKAESKSLVLINNGKETIKLKAQVRGSGLLSVECPRQLRGGQSEGIIFTYNPSKDKPVYGTVTDTVTILADGKPCQLEYCTTAILTDDFTQITDNSPKPALSVDPSYKDFGTNSPRKILKTTVTIENQGNADLIIRAVEVSSETVTDLEAGTVIKPNGKKTATVAVTTSAVSGELTTGSIDLITNDPVRPRRELRFRSRAK